jgi:hypothetical protein
MTLAPRPLGQHPSALSSLRHGLRCLSSKGAALLGFLALVSGLALIRALAGGDRTDLCRWLGPSAPGEPCDGSAWLAHADDLTFEWYELGMRILIVTGRYGYHKETSGSWSRAPRAHNTVEIDGTDFATRDVDRYGAGLESIEQTEFGFVLRGLRRPGRGDRDRAQHRPTLRPGRPARAARRGSGRTAAGRLSPAHQGRTRAGRSSSFPWAARPTPERRAL